MDISVSINVRTKVINLIINSKLSVRECVKKLDFLRDRSPKL